MFCVEISVYSLNFWLLYLALLFDKKSIYFIFNHFLFFFTVNLTLLLFTSNICFQILSGTHVSVYWTANYIFDFFMYLFNILTMLTVLSIVSSLTSNKNSEAFILMRSHPENFFYLLGFLVVASFAWSTFAYVCSFFFKSEVAGFSVLFGILSVANFMDMIFGYVNYFHNMASCSVNFTDGKMSCTKSDEKVLFEIVRLINLFVFPNIPVKRAFYGLKVESYHCKNMSRNFGKQSLNRLKRRKYAIG